MIKKLLSNVSLSPGNSKQFVIVDPVEAKGERLLVQRDAGRVMLSPLPSNEAANQRHGIRDSLPSSQFTVMCIPRRFLHVRYVRVPSVDPDEIRRMIQFEVDGLMPYPRRETIYDCQIMGSDEDGYSRVLVTGVRRQKVEACLEYARSLGVELDRLIPTTLALQATLDVLHSDTGKPVILVDTDGDRLEIAVLNDGQIVFSRDCGMHTSLCAEERLAFCGVEMVSGICTAIDKLHDSPSPRILIRTCKKVGDHLRDKLQNDLGLSAELIDEVDSLPHLQRHAGRDPEDSGKLSVSLRLAGLALIAMRESRVGINLLPEEVKNRHKAVARRLRVVKAAALGIVCAAALGVAAQATLARKQRTVAMLDRALRKIRPLARDVEQKRTELKLIKEQLSGEAIPFDLIMELYELTPNGVTLNQLTLDSQRGMTLRGQASALSQAFDYLGILEKSESFKGAEMRFARKHSVGEKEIASFEIYRKTSREVK